MTNSPRYPQRNREAEQTVQTIKNHLTNAEEPYLTLLAYRSTPLQNGFHLAQMLMGHRQRNTIPTRPSQLDPALPDSAVIKLKEMERWIADQMQYNKRHRESDLINLPPGRQMWVTDA